MAKINAAEIVKDIRSGISLSELMEKYQIPSEEKLDLILNKLLNAGYLKQSDIEKLKNTQPQEDIIENQPIEIDDEPVSEKTKNEKRKKSIPKRLLETERYHWTADVAEHILISYKG